MIENSSPTSIKNILWLAGFFEGEGSFFAEKHRFCKIRMTACSTDYDTIERVKKITNGRVQIVNRPSGLGFKQQYVINLNGTLAIMWMMILYKLMSNRRKVQILNCIKIWKNTPNFRKSSLIWKKYE